ncbi:MAG: citrate (Si)-synthase [Candidatus Marinimicrobia bacterium]|jgi:citrate synthase|nr:citrate (Si)-synthase [Candidatus Neomarinimicrobiota bacterium]MBT3945935.1 citrate (Si)-synthase [Candidatus Neomarinimicrobiota bacterium]MBT6414440.1 citrate (Si)-synthase [Candidatus Neomarinimicrobiota bacterium]MBT6797819.1 citrate (Si)-synthase [Candidatus Neomarinimicrobiota bacterium]MBT6866722.1 citrate (Si)-synthase [Candidatus Neomarinimicrobiota bacterium]
MSLLNQEIKRQIPVMQKEIKDLIATKGDQKISEVTVAQAFSGLRGIKAFVCDTSSVSADKGLIIRGMPLLDITHISPEEVFYLLLTSRLPNDAELSDLKSQYSEHLEVPDYVWNVLKEMPDDSHPMTLFNTAILAMQGESVFREKYDNGMPKTEFWEAILEDGIRLLAKLPTLGAGIYRMRFNKGERIAPDSTKDWSGNFVHMTGLPDETGDFEKLMKLYFMLHCDHEGGNVSAFASHTVASALSDPYYAVSAGLNGLAGPLHGLANQECLKFVLSVRDDFNGVPTEDELREYCWNRLKSGRVIPGYGHAVLRCSDPRFTAFINFGQSNIKNDEIFTIVDRLFNVVPDVLQEHGKAKNPWPNVDAASGSLLYYYGLKEFNFYTVLFSISRTMGMISQMVWERALGIPITRPKSVTTDWIKQSV